VTGVNEGESEGENAVACFACRLCDSYRRHSWPFPATKRTKRPCYRLRLKLISYFLEAVDDGKYVKEE